MKYLRKMVALLIGIVLFASIVICAGKIFAIKNININLITYENDCTDSYNEAKESLKSFKGASLLFLNEKDIEKAVSGGKYAVASCEKKFPCTVNVVLKERLEVFAVSVGGLFAMYDGDGKFIRSCLENENDNDGTPNVELVGIVVENIPSIAVIASTFKGSFGSLRSIVKSINLDSKPGVEGYADKLIFNLRCGLKIQLDDYVNDTEAKIDAAYKEFCTLTDRQKLSGRIRGYRIGGEDGIINADYSAI